MKYEKLTYDVLQCAYEVHSTLGPGLFEAAYQFALVYELLAAGFKIEVQKSIPLEYKGQTMETSYRLDIVVEGCLVLELKSIKCFTDVHEAQMLTYLNISKCPVGLLINFNVKSLKSGIKRFVI